MLHLIMINPSYETATWVWDAGYNTGPKQRLEELEAKGYLKLWELYREKAIWSELVKTITMIEQEDKEAVIVIMGVMHGAPDLTVGYKNTLMFACDDETAALCKRFHILDPHSCLMGQQLAPYMQKEGLHLSIGEIPEYVIVGDPTHKTTAAFIFAELELIERMVKALENKEKVDMKTLWDAVRAGYKTQIEQWENTDVAYWLKKDLDGRVAFLDGWLFPPEIQPPPQPPQPPQPKKKLRIKLKIESDLTGNIYIGPFRVGKVYIYSLGKNIAGEAEEEE